MEISKEWTQEERLALIGALAAQAGEDMRTTGRVRSARPQEGPLEATYHLLECVRFVACMPAEFLEANRAQVLAWRR